MMANGDSVDAQLYIALMQNNCSEVLELCKRHAEGPFRTLTERKDTVLHLALYSMQVDLVRSLLDSLTVGQHRKMNHPNSSGNNILHEAATQDNCIEAARWIMKLQPQLLSIPNNKGESPIFRAVRYGQMKMFKFLSSEVEKLPLLEEHRIKFYIKTNIESSEEVEATSDTSKNKKADRTYTILHISIYHEHFELAYYIAKKFPYLVGEKNHHGMTGLQILSMNPSAFRNRDQGWLKYLGRSRPRGIEVALSCRVPWWDTIHKERQRYCAAVKLAKFLIKEDTAWIKEQKPKDEEEKAKKPPTPLILATKWGCVEIVREILRLHPQTVEQVGSEYGSILHIAIQYRRIEIFDMVEKMKMPMRRLVRKNDRNGNSILHMVGEKITDQKPTDQKTTDQNSTDQKPTDQKITDPKPIDRKTTDQKTTDRKTTDQKTTDQKITDQKTTDQKSDKKDSSILPWIVQQVEFERRSPAFELQDDLLLFERVEGILKTHYHKNVNSKGQTADQVFAMNNEELQGKAQDWFKRTAENCSIVAVLFATVAFAAAYTVPGGLNPENGSPVLINQTFFVVFTISDVLSLTFTLTAVVIFLSILTSPFQLQDYKRSLPQKLMVGLTCLIFSVTMMMLAFGSTIILMIKNKEQWTKIALYTVAFLPVTVLAVSYLPLYVPLMRTFNYTLDKIGSFFPRFIASDTNRSDDTATTSSFDDIVPVHVITTTSP